MKNKMKCSSGFCLLACALAAGVLLQPLVALAKEQELTTITGVPGNGCVDGRTESARFASPLGLDVKNKGVIIADTDNNLIRSVYGGRVSTLAGCISGRDAYGNALGGFHDTSLSGAAFSAPADCLYLSDGRIAVVDRNNHAIRIVSDSWVYTLSGTGEAGYEEGRPGRAMFSSPSGLAEGPDGSIYVADMGNNCIRKISREGTTSLVAGVPGQGGLRDSAAEEALFLEPLAVAVDDDGSVYVADSGNQRIRKIADGQVTTLAGGAESLYLDTEYRTPGLSDGQGGAARFSFPGGICLAGRVLIVADTGNHVVRAVSPSGRVQTIAGSGEAGYEDGAALSAGLYSPGDVAWEDGTLYIMDTGSSALRAMDFDPEAWLESIGEGENGKNQ